MAYSVPQLLIFQEFGLAPQTELNNRTPFIIAGHAALFRFSDEDEKTVINLGDYDELTDTPYLWPGRPTGSQVDFDYVKLFIEDALLLYFTDSASVGGLVTPVANHANRVRSAAHAFKTNIVNDTTYPRSASLYDRDARIGDVAYIRGVAASVSYELWSTIAGFSGELEAAVIGDIEAADSNHDEQNLSAWAVSLGLNNAITLTIDASDYDGLPTGDIDEVYTIEVIQSSIGEDLTTARLRVTSSSGRDNQASVTPAAAGDPTEIGTRGLLVTFDLDETASASSNAEDAGVSDSDLVIGQKWRVIVHQLYTNFDDELITGPYTGTKNTTYIVEITRGAAAGAEVPAQITVTTTTGTDFSGPTNIEIDDVVAIGTKGLTIQFTPRISPDSTGFRKGDKWYVEVTAEFESSLQTLILADDLPVEIQDAADLDLKLYIRDTIQVSKNRTGAPPLTNWDVSDTEFTANSAIEVYDESWTDGGEQLALPVKFGTLYSEYRAWLPTFVGEVGEVTEAGDVADSVGVADKDNPLFQALFHATLVSNGQKVLFTGVQDPNDLDAWLAAIDLASGRDDMYNLVPITYDVEVHDAVTSMVTAETGKNRFKASIVCPQIGRSKAVVSADSSSDEEEVLATLADDPLTSGTQYTKLSVPANNGKFITNNVQALDIVRYLYSTDGFDNETYEEFTVDEVLSENTLRLAAGHDVAISVPQKIEIWRNLRGTGLATEAADTIGRYGNRRIVAIANDTFDYAGDVLPGYFLGCVVAGLRAAALQHRPLTRVQMTGIDGVGSLIKSLNDNQLDQIATVGGWIVIRNVDGNFVNRHALTTDMTDLNRQEEVVRVNVDAIAKALRNGVESYIGRSLVTREVLANLRATIEGILLEQTKITASDLGPALINYQILELRQHAVLKDKVIVRVRLEIPYPMNFIDLFLEV